MSYRVVPVETERHKERLFALWREHYSTIIETKYGWMYERNPAGRASVWLLEDEGTREFVGSAALFPRWFVQEGRRVLGAFAGDLFVREEHRTLGPALMLHRQILKEVVPKGLAFVLALPNRASEPIVKRLGYTALGGFVRCVCPIRVSPLLNRLPGGGVWALMFGRLLDMLSSAYHRVRTSAGAGDGQHRPDIPADANFSAIADSLSHRFAVFGERTPCYLHWKFNESPFSSAQTIYVPAPDGRGLAYAVLRRVEGVLDVADMAAAGDAALRRLVDTILRRALEARVDAVSIRCLPWSGLDRFGHRGFLVRPDDQRAFVWAPPGSQSPTQSGEGRSWYLLSADDDN